MKKIVILSVITLLVFMSSITVSAKSCTGYKGAPYFYEVAPDRKEDTYPLQTAANQCLGSNTAVYFTNFRSFPDSYKYPDATFYVTLYEEDPPGNEDERIKRYFFIVRNKVVDEVRLDGTYTMGAIDSAGDQTCELYLLFEGATGTCCNRPINNSVLDYNICMN